MSSPSPSPTDRYEELAEAAIDLVHYAAIAGLICESVQCQTAPYRVPAMAEGFTDLLLTPLQDRAFGRAINDLNAAAEKLNDVLKRHDG